MNNTNNSSLADKNTSESRKKPRVNDSLTTTDYKAASYWSNVLYGIGMLAFILIPVVIPGMTAKVTAIGLYSIILSIYVIALFDNIIRTRKPGRNRKRVTSH